MAMQRGNQKKKSMFFEKMVKDKGNDWLERVSPPEIGRSARILYKDIVFGSIDKSLYGMAFFNYQFMLALHTDLSDRMRSESMLCEALNALAEKYDKLLKETMNNQFALSSNPLFMEESRKHYSLLTIYSTLLYCIDQIYVEGKLEYLDVAANQLKSLTKYVQTI